MAQIKGYTFTPRAIEAYDGWNSETKTLTPMTFEDGDGRWLHEALDNITLAAEAGVLDNFLWPQQLFADKGSYEWFIAELQNYDESYRITDQWWTALSSLVDNVDEEEFVSASEIADKLNSFVFEFGLIKNFGLETPIYKYSLEEVKKACLEECKNTFSHGKYFNTLDVKVWRHIQEVSNYAKFYGFQLSEDDVASAGAEGRALRVPDKATPTKKVATKKATKK